MPAIESRIGSAWFAKQAAKGSPATTAMKLGRKVGGDMTVARSDGAENYEDGQRFQNSQDFVDNILGNGNPTLQGQPGVLAALFYLMLGQEVVTGAGDPFEHVSTPNSAGSFWSTWWKKVGGGIVLRQKFNDCRLVSLRVEGSSATKIVRVIPTFISLDSGEIFAGDPVQAEDADDALIYTEGAGRFNIDGVVYRAHSSFAFTVTDGVAPWYGDDVVPQDVVFGQGNIAIENVTMLVDQAGLSWYYTQIYGTPTPAVGAKPLRNIPLLGSYQIDLRRGALFNVAVASATGGTFTLTATGPNGVAQATAPIAYNAAPGAVQTALQALPGLGTVQVTGAPGAYQVTFQTGTPTLTASGAALTGAGAAVTVTAGGPRRQCKVEFPAVKWSPDLTIASTPDGGATELGLGAQTRRPVNGTDPHIRTTIRCGDAAYA